jgi:hypothetical protein
MFSRMLGSGSGFFRSCTLGRKLSNSSKTMVAKNNPNAMTSQTRLCRASMNTGATRRPSKPKRGGFISNLALQWGQIRLRHALKLNDDGVVTSFLQTGQVAIEGIHSVLRFFRIVPPDR